jgi:putative restriction endonuclease
MSQFWWVNHKQTVRQEIDGQYLWSPKTKSNGTSNTFYDNMRRATPGDFVLSYADQQIRYVGRVAEFAFTAPKP